MYRRFAIVLGALLSFSMSSFGADYPNEEEQNFSLLFQDNFFDIVATMDICDLRALGHCSKTLQKKVLDMLDLTVVNVSMTAESVVGLMMGFNHYAVVTNTPYPLESLLLSCPTIKDLIKIQEKAFFKRCPFAAKTLKIEAGAGSEVCLLSENLNEIVRRQPTLEKIEITNNTFKEIMHRDAFLCYQELTDLKECTIKGMCIGSACLQNILACSSLVSLNIDNLDSESQKIPLPQNLKVCFGL
jgi:hypothetical protein